MSKDVKKAKELAEAQAKMEAETKEKAEADAKAKIEHDNANKPLGLPELDAKYRVAAWQSAALTRLMGWEEGKRVTENDYITALDTMSNRRIGG